MGLQVNVHADLPLNRVVVVVREAEAVIRQKLRICEMAILKSGLSTAFHGLARVINDGEVSFIFE